MLDIEATSSNLYLVYRVDYGSPDWVREKLELGSVDIIRVFHFKPNDVADVAEVALLTADEDAHGETDDPDGPRVYYFRLGRLRDGYYRIARRKLALSHDLYLASGLAINVPTFVAHRNISIFRHVDELLSENIYVGGEAPSAIPADEFARLLKAFPNSTELDHYSRSRIARLLRDYFETLTPAEQAFQAYLSKKGAPPPIVHGVGEVATYERQKYEFIRNRMVELLKEESAFGENEWRDLMVQFLLLIFPKYVAVLRNVMLKDFYSSPGKTKKRFVDVALVDANGHLDLIEIKKPFANALVSAGQYRDNYTPRKELAGAIMQAEKYLFHLNKWGVDGEEAINQRHKRNLPADLRILITNPKAIIIAGRSNNLSKAQVFDFEFIKRKYANVIDILSYDDLLHRLENTIDRFAPP